MKRHIARIETAYHDALTLAVWRCQGIIPSRRYASIYGITQNRHENAIALLRMARVIEKHRTWAVEDLQTIKFRMRNAKNAALEVPEAYHARLTVHAQS